MAEKYRVTGLQESQNNIDDGVRKFDKGEDAQPAGDCKDCTCCGREPSSEETSASGEYEASKIKEIKEVVADLYHRVLMLTEVEDPASDDFANLVDSVSESIDELKRTHRDFQRHIFYQIIAEGMQAIHKRGLCLESVRHNDIIFRVDEGGEVVSSYDDSQIPF